MMNNIKEYIIGIISLIIMIALFIIFLEYIYIFGALYLILFTISIIVFIILVLKNNKNKELFKKINIAFLAIGIISIIFGTQMISYGLRYLRFNTEILINKQTYVLYFDEIHIYNPSTFEENFYTIESDHSCTNYSNDEEINTSPCEITILDKDEVSIKLSLTNYFGNIEYKFNDGNWKETKGGNYTLKSKYVGLFKKEYIYSDYSFPIDNDQLIDGENMIRIKYREKEVEFIFKYNKEKTVSNENEEE